MGATVASRSDIQEAPGGDDTSGIDLETQYTIITNPSAIFTLQVSPTAYAYLSKNYVAPPGTQNISAAAFADVSYSVTPTTLAITFDAPVLGSPGSYKCLVGQQVTAHLSITLDPDENSDGSPAYHWTEDGGKPFASYSASLSAGFVTAIDPSIYSTPSPTVHFSKKDTAKVSCSGSIHGLSFNVGEDLSVLLPNVSVIEASCGPSGYEDEGTNGIDGVIGLILSDKGPYWFQYWLQVETPVM